MSTANTAMNASHCDHSMARPSSVGARRVISGGKSSTATTGPTSTPIMWFVEVSASRYMMSSRW